MKYPHKQNIPFLNGFTLIEVMVALLIFAFAATSLTVGFQSSTNASIRAEQNLQAHMVAQYQIEKTFLAGTTEQRQLKSPIIIEMFEKKWSVTQQIVQLNEIKIEEESPTSEIGEFEDGEIYSETFNLDGQSQLSDEVFEIPDRYLIYTVEVTPEDNIGFASLQTLLIKGLKQ